MRIKIKEDVPRFYRRAWLDAPEGQFVCLPIGIHWVVKTFYRLWHWTQRYDASDLEIKELEAYHRGIEDQKDGWAAECDDFGAQIQKQLDKETNDKD